MAPYASASSSAGAGVWSKSHLAKHRPASFIHAVLALAVLVCSPSSRCVGAQSDLPPPAVRQLEETNAPELLHTYRQLQQQIHTTQVAIEQSRQETRDAAAQTADALSNALQTIQETFSARRARDLEAMRGSNRVILIVVGTFAAMSFLSMLMMSYFQWRMSKGLAEISATLPAALGLDPASVAAALALANQPELPLFGAIERPEQRAQELQQGPRAALGRPGVVGVAIGDRLFSVSGALVRRRRLRAISMALIVGLIFAAGLAFLLYAVAYRKFGFG
jgi:hypothetical protein